MIQLKNRPTIILSETTEEESGELLDFSSPTSAFYILGPLACYSFIYFSRLKVE
jgi:hypothetical protein